MPALHLRRRPLKWGNGYGIRLTRSEMERLGTDPETPLELEVRPGALPVDVSKLHVIEGRKTGSVAHTALSAERRRARR